MRRILLLASAATIVMLGGQTWWAVEQDRRLTIESERRNGLVAVRLLEEHAKVTLAGAVASLDAVVKAIDGLKDGRGVDDAAITAVLARAQSDNKVLKALQYVNPAGVAQVSSSDYPAYQTDSDDRTYIPTMLKDHNHVAVVLGTPFKRYYDSEFVVPMARNVRGVDGTYLGIISTDISVSYFSGVYTRVAKDSKALVALFTRDGKLIARSPFDKKYVGMDISKSAGFVHLEALTRQEGGVEGSFEDDQFLDESVTAQRLYVYRTIEGFPITTVIARDMKDILLAWRRRAISRVVFFGLTAGIIGALTYFSWRSMKEAGRS